MKTNYKLTLTLLAGAILGAATIHGIKAQGKPLAYVVVDIADMTDAQLYRTLIPKALDAISAYKRLIGPHRVVQVEC